MQYGAVLTLNNKPNRLEHSAIFVCDEWIELWHLLKGPVGYLLAKTPLNSPPWELEQPLTVVLESGDTASGQRRSATIASNFLQQADPTFFLAADEGENAAALAFSDSQLLAEAFPNGGFVAEFAIGTRTLIIRYFLPPAGMFAPRFTLSTIEPYTIAVIPGIGPMAGTDIGQLHFDIPSDPVEKASFIVDILNDPTDVMKHLLGMQNTTPPCSATLVDLIDLNGNTPVARPGTPISTLTKEPTKVGVTKMTVEYCAPPQICCPCVDMSITSSGDFVEVHDLILKGYAC